MLRLSSGQLKKGAGHTASLPPWLFLGLIVRAASRTCKLELLMVVLAKSEQENGIF